MERYDDYSHFPFLKKRGRPKVSKIRKDLFMKSVRGKVFFLGLVLIILGGAVLYIVKSNYYRESLKNYFSRQVIPNVQRFKMIIGDTHSKISKYIGPIKNVGDREKGSESTEVDKPIGKIKITHESGDEAYYLLYEHHKIKKVDKEIFESAMTPESKELYMSEEEFKRKIENNIDLF